MFSTWGCEWTTYPGLGTESRQVPFDTEPTSNEWAPAIEGHVVKLALKSGDYGVSLIIVTSASYGFYNSEVGADSMQSPEGTFLRPVGCTHLLDYLFTCTLQELRNAQRLISKSNCKQEHT